LDEAWTELWLGKQHVTWWSIYTESWLLWNHSRAGVTLRQPPPHRQHPVGSFSVLLARPSPFPTQTDPTGQLGRIAQGSGVHRLTVTWSGFSPFWPLLPPHLYDSIAQLAAGFLLAEETLRTQVWCLLLLLGLTRDG
jgi:hypothetical protein